MKECNSQHWDHPRGCGEKLYSRRSTSSGRGSSPRVRGKAETSHRKPSSAGIIPAGAGKSALAEVSVNRDGDHPRGCGEKGVSFWACSGQSGSSPRVRGKARLRAAAARDSGIIPAGAGKRLEKRRRRLSARDHPRGCGEKTSTTHRACEISGSSPRVRGKVPGGCYDTPRQGIIPAGAGKSGWGVIGG